MKKILSLTLVLVLVLSSFSMAFADSNTSVKFNDVDDKDVATAVDRLNAFGIVDGYSDGSYKPKAMVTRAEFAKLLVTALGLENAAGAATGSSQFADIDGSEWYAGFVNVAAGQGIIGGYPDGTFKPNAQVNYGEAVTMLVRALGYKDEFLPGAWPSNYVSKAADLDITDDVAFFPSGQADRGSVAVLLNNTLDANVIKQKTFTNVNQGNEWYESETKTLLTENLNLVTYERFTVTSVPRVDSGLDKDDIQVTGIEDEVAKIITGDEAQLSDTKVNNTEVETFEVVNGIDPNELLGESLNLYVNDDDEVVYVEKSDLGYETLYASIDKDSALFDTGSDFDAELTLYKPDGSDKDYDLSNSSSMDENDNNFDTDADVSVYVDNAQKDDIDALDELVDSDNKNAPNYVLFGKIVLDGQGNVKLLDMNEWNDGFKGYVVTDTDDDYIDYFIDNENTDRLETDDDYDAFVVRDEEGNMMELSDIEKNDVMYLSNADDESTGDDTAYITVVRNSMEGEIDYYKSDEVSIDDKDYDVSYGTISSDDNDNIAEFGTDDGNDYADDLTAADANVKVLFDLVKNVRHISSDVESSSNDKYGVVTGTETSYGDTSAKIVNEENDEVEYDFDISKDDITDDKSDDPADLEDGDVVKFTLDSNGDIDSLVILARDDSDNFVLDNDNVTSVSDIDVDVNDLDDKISDDEIEVNGKDYTYDDGLVVIDYNATVEDSDYGDANFMDSSNLEDKGANGNSVVVYSDDNGEAKLLVINSDMDTEEEYGAYVTDAWTNDGTTYIKAITKEGTTEYELDSGDVTDENAYALQVNSDGTVDVLLDDDNRTHGTTSNDFEVVVGQVTDIDGKYIEIDVDGTSTGAAVSVATNSDTVYGEDDDATLDLYDIDEKDLVVIIKDGAYASVVEKLDDVSDDDTEDNDGKVENEAEEFNRDASFNINSGDIFDSNGWLK